MCKGFTVLSHVGKSSEWSESLKCFVTCKADCNTMPETCCNFVGVLLLGTHKRWNTTQRVQFEDLGFKTPFINYTPITMWSLKSVMLRNKVWWCCNKHFIKKLFYSVVLSFYIDVSAKPQDVPSERLEFLNFWHLAWLVSSSWHSSFLLLKSEILTNDTSVQLTRTDDEIHHKICEIRYVLSAIY